MGHHHKKGHRDLLSTRQAQERVFLFGVRFPGDNPDECDEHLEELHRLVETAGGLPVGQMIQVLREPRPSTLIGAGKVEELKEALLEHKADSVVFDHELTPAQQRNLTEALGIKVLERAQLILDIFVAAARSREAKHQVELAQMEYLLPRLAGMWKHLERQRGGIGVRGGPGEAQIELDRRMIREKISRLKKRLEEIEKQRQTQSKRRGQLFQVALVGYTNAGKSTLLNRLTGADIYVADQLFATLDSTVKSLSDRPGERTLLIDTVGFIRKLPTQLVASFRSTLAAVLEADFLLIVGDASSQVLDEHPQVVREVLQEIGAGSMPWQLVLNKADRLSPEERSDLELLNPEAHLCSAQTGDGIGPLRTLVGEKRQEWEDKRKAAARESARKRQADEQAWSH